MENNNPEPNNNQSSEFDETEDSQKIHFFTFTEDHKKEAEQIIEQDIDQLSPQTFQKFEEDARRNWDIFFLKNKDNFYKDRHYISREFGLDTKVSNLKTLKNRRLNYLEIGCAVGNTMFPLMELYKQDMYVFGFDFSHNAVNCIRGEPRYNTDDIYAFVGDLVKIQFPLKVNLAAGVEKYNQVQEKKDIEIDFENLSPSEIILPKMDFVSLIFVLSAINPIYYNECLKKVYDQMESDSYFYFRDYGKYDLAMLRFAKKKDAKLGDNFYLKSDGTRCYYFEETELKELLETAG